MRYKMAVVPKSGLSLRILKTFMTRKELKDLMSRYMEAKAKMYLETCSAAAVKSVARALKDLQRG